MEVMVKTLEDVKSEVWASTEHDGSMGLWGKVMAQGRSLLPEALVDVIAILPVTKTAHADVILAFLVHKAIFSVFFSNEQRNA